MPDEEREKHEGEPRPPGTGGIEVRPRNWLVPVTLLSLRQWNSYGYKLIEQTAALGLGAMNPGTFYRTLRNMVRDGLCESEWEANKAGPARRVYSITDAGEAYLGFWAEALEQYRRNTDAFFSLYMGRSPARTDQQKGDG